MVWGEECVGLENDDLDKGTCFEVRMSLIMTNENPNKEKLRPASLADLM